MTTYVVLIARYLGEWPECIFVGTASQAHMRAHKAKTAEPNARITILSGQEREYEI